MPAEAGGSTTAWSIAARRYWYAARRRLPVSSLAFGGRVPDRLLFAPPDLRPADASLAADIYGGRFRLHGILVDCAGRSPFDRTEADPRWLDALHGFRWLRHLHAAGTDLAAAHGRVLVRDWLRLHGRRKIGAAWKPETCAERLIALLQHAPLVLKGAEASFHRAYLKSLRNQVRHLQACVPALSFSEARLRGFIALVYAALTMPAAPSSLRGSLAGLDEELDAQIDADGGPVSRDPAFLVDLLLDLLPLRQALHGQNDASPVRLISAIERMQPALRFFLHSDGSIARFNGNGTTPSALAAVLRHGRAGPAPGGGTLSGYQRLDAGGVTVIADTGPPPPAAFAQRAAAGCLAFELSTAAGPVIVDGAGRGTAAHSTACVETMSFRAEGAICERRDVPGWQGFAASHDGYVRRFGLVHERQMALAEDGGCLSGADFFHREGEGSAPLRTAIRFHLHAQVDASVHDGIVQLHVGRRERWLFECDTIGVSIEQSGVPAMPGAAYPHRAIMLSLDAGSCPAVRWRFTRL